MEQSNQAKPNIFKSFLMALAIMVVFTAIAILFGAFRLPFWPFVFFLFYFAAIAGMDRSKLLTTAVGGFIGLSAGFSNSVVAALTGSDTIGLVVFLAGVTILITLLMDGRIRFVNTFCMFMVTCLSGFSESLVAEAYLPGVVSYLIAVLLFTGITALLAKREKTAVANSE